MPIEKLPELGDNEIRIILDRGLVQCVQVGQGVNDSAFWISRVDNDTDGLSNKDLCEDENGKEVCFGEVEIERK